ncbi:glycosyltransferase [Mangrovibacterium lignilyticum]|uniref:glycosyltransferase n=1 Tax=Mangrovibacterium lignilyticum TaxID=2668052 RepID=UPI0013CF5EAC|nr:glycosyltransferase [Mangrovibacterium lignilyticum]
MTQEFFDRPVYEWSGYFFLFFGFILSLVIQLFFYRRILSVRKVSEDIQEERPISVLLNVRNESERIEQFLLKLLDQNYSSFEIVVVDDFSADSTLIILGVMAQKYPKIKFSSLNQENRYSEKMAMNLAMKAAKNDWVLILTPEANLEDPNYLARMNQEMDADSQVLVSYVNYEAEGKRLNRLCRVERLDAFWRASANMSASIPLFYQQVNVLFNKKLYFDNGGFKGKMNDHYAGLELIFNQMERLKVTYCLSPQTSLREKRITNKNEFEDLICKHIRIFSGLNFSKKWLVWLERFSKLLVLSGLLVLLFTDLQYWYFYVPIPFIAIFIQIVLIKSLLKRLAEKKIFLSSFIYVFIRPFLYLFYKASIYLQVQRHKWN